MKKVVVFGTGKCAQDVLDGIVEPMQILAFVDNDVTKVGTIEQIYGKYEIVQPSMLRDMEFDYVYICSSYWYEIANQLYDMGIDIYRMVFPYITDFKKFVSFWFEKSGEKERADSSEKEMLIQYLTKHCGEPSYHSCYNYEYMKKYDNEYEIHEDGDLQYLLFEGKRIYFPKDSKWDNRFVNKWFNTIVSEVDENSPHRYNVDQIKHGDVIVDIGAAEGLFSLMAMDKVSKAYIIEMEPKWIRALEKTFEPYKDKVVLINKKVGVGDGLNALDSLITEEEVNYIKLDIDGYESVAIMSATELIRRSKHINIAACTYHNSGDEEKVRAVFEDLGLDVKTSNGYMLTPNVWEKKYTHGVSFKRGVLFGMK